MRTLILANRNAKEIVRDPIAVFFGICFPVLILLLLSLIQSNIPVEMFSPQKLAPGISVFGLSFVSLFSGLLIAKDRTSAFLMRLYSSPIKPPEFIIAYALPFVPLSLVQGVVTLSVGLALGMKITINLITTLLFIIPISFLYIGIGILSGACLNDKQVGGVCGALLTNVSAWLSGIWFDISLLGNALETAAYCLPFANAIKLVQLAYAGDWSEMAMPFVVVMIYAIAIFVLAIFVFAAKMRSDRK